MPQINSIRGLSSIKAISKCEVNPTSGFQDIAFTSNCGRTDRRTDGQTDGRTLRRTGRFHNTSRLSTGVKNNDKKLDYVDTRIALIKNLHVHVSIKYRPGFYYVLTTLSKKYVQNLRSRSVAVRRRGTGRDLVFPLYGVYMSAQWKRS